MSGKPLRHNMAKVEFLGCLEKIESMLAQGFSKRIIYERLFEEKRLTMAYVTFCKLTVRAAQSSLPAAPQLNAAPVLEKAVSHPPPAPNPQPLAQQAPRSGPRIIKSDKEPFPNPKGMKISDGI